MVKVTKNKAMFEVSEGAQLDAMLAKGWRKVGGETEEAAPAQAEEAKPAKKGKGKKEEAAPEQDA